MASIHSMNPDDSIEWRDLGDLFVEGPSPLPIVHHPHLTLPEGLDLDSTIPPLDMELQDASSPHGAEQVYITIPSEANDQEEIEVAPIVTKLLAAVPEAKTEPQGHMHIDMVKSEVTPQVDSTLHTQPQPAAAPVVTKLAATVKAEVLSVPSVVKVEDAKVAAGLGHNPNPAKTAAVSVADRTPKRARVPVVTAVPTMPVAKGKVEKATGVGRSLKEKREREAKQFPKALLSNLNGTTSAEVRKMTQSERDLVLFKRKLRNRESARRSRQKRQATLADLHDEIGELINTTTRMVDVAANLQTQNKLLADKLEVANAEIRALRCVLPADEAHAETRKVGA